MLYLIKVDTQTHLCVSSGSPPPGSWCERWVLLDQLHCCCSAQETQSLLRATSNGQTRAAVLSSKPGLLSRPQRWARKTHSRVHLSSRDTGATDGAWQKHEWWAATCSATLHTKISAKSWLKGWALINSNWCGMSARRFQGHTSRGGTYKLGLLAQGRLTRPSVTQCSLQLGVGWGWGFQAWTREGGRNSSECSKCWRSATERV